MCMLQEEVDLDEWLETTHSEGESGLLNQKLLQKLGLDGASKRAWDTRTSADDSADDDRRGRRLPSCISCALKDFCGGLG